VKRKLGSANLSHLFSQGYVSADLLLMSEEYRRKVIEKINDALQNLPHGTDGNGVRDRFLSLVTHDRINPSSYEVVYAITAKWGRGEKARLSTRLPFFSKVNLRRHAQDLRRMGYHVSYKRIDIRGDDE